MTTELAADLGVDVGDVDVLLEQLAERDPQLPDELATFLRRLLDPHDERTAPASSGPARTQSAGAPTGWVGPDRAEDGRALTNSSAIAEYFGRAVSYVSLPNHQPRVPADRRDRRACTAERQ
jgi:hypothetical protein